MASMLLAVFTISLMSLPDAFSETTTYDLELNVGKGEHLRTLIGVLTNTDGDWNGSFTVNDKSFTIQSAMFFPNADNPSSMGIQATNDGVGLDRFLSLSILTTEDGFVIDSNARMPSQMQVINPDADEPGEIKKRFPISSGVITIHE